MNYLILMIYAYSWSYNPFTANQLGVYIDDKTRLITSYGMFKRATAENTIALLHSGITEYDKPKLGCLKRVC